MLLCATLVSLELGTRLAFAWFEDWPTLASVQASFDDPNEPETNRERSPGELSSNVLHPYLGYVRNPLHIPKHIRRGLPDASINGFGFLQVQVAVMKW